MAQLDSVVFITTREQFAQARAAAESRRQAELDFRPHGVIVWTVVMFLVDVAFFAGYLVGHVGRL